MKKRATKRWLRKYDGKKYGWFLLARDSALMLILAALLFSLLVGVSRVNGTSMLPTLENGRIVFFLRAGSSYDRGDVVFAKMPSGSFYVKRVLAVEGDVVDIRDGCLYINGVREAGDYWQGRTLPQEGIVEYPLTLGEGMYFLVGDNREGSIDSRSFGPLPAASIRGKLLFV